MKEATEDHHSDSHFRVDGSQNRFRALAQSAALRRTGEAEVTRADHLQQLAIKGIQAALRGLRELGTIEDVFDRAPARRSRGK